MQAKTNYGLNNIKGDGGIVAYRMKVPMPQPEKPSFKAFYRKKYPSELETLNAATQWQSELALKAWSDEEWQRIKEGRLKEVQNSRTLNCFLDPTISLPRGITMMPKSRGYRIDIRTKDSEAKPIRKDFPINTYKDKAFEKAVDFQATAAKKGMGRKGI